MNIYLFYQAEDGIRDYKVTGVQTCALPISVKRRYFTVSASTGKNPIVAPYSGAMFPIVARSASDRLEKIGRASCRERVYRLGVNGERNEEQETRHSIGFTKRYGIDMI